MGLASMSESGWLIPDSLHLPQVQQDSRAGHGCSNTGGTAHRAHTAKGKGG